MESHTPVFFVIKYIQLDIKNVYTNIYSRDIMPIDTKIPHKEVKQMALAVYPYVRAIQLELDAGTDTDGKKIVRKRTLSGIKTEAADQDVFDVAVALYGLQSYLMTKCVVTDRKELREE